VFATALWAALALASLAVRDSLHGVLLVWLPSGVAVATMHAIDRKQWPGFLALLFLVQIAVILYNGTGFLNALGLAVSTTVQALICTDLGRRALGGRARIPRGFSHVIGLFAAAVLGCLAGASLAFPFRPEQTLGELSWWFLANVLGVLAGAPLLLALRQAVGIGAKVQHLTWDRWFLPAMTLVGGLAWLCLSFGIPELIPVLVAAMVFVTVRYGEPSPACIVLVYAAIATLLSLGGASPAPEFTSDPQDAALTLQAWLLVMLATTVPLAALLTKQDALAEQLQGRNLSLQQNLTIFDLAEGLAGIGRWRYDLVSGLQDWSPKMLELNGLSPDLAPDPGDVRALLPDKGEALFGMIAANRDAREAYSFNYRVKPTGQVERILRISILNEFDQKGRRIALFAVAMDVTEQVRREEALEMARGRAVQLAAEAQLLANTDPLTGLANRRCALSRLKLLIQQAEKAVSPLSVVMFDIDHFKRVNDGFGHQMGDEVLIRVAQLATSQVRAGDLLGRIGGEEFVWLLPGVVAPKAHQLAERLRHAIEESSGKDGLPQVTASIGIASLRPGDDVERVLARADTALYEAKEGGRNRVKLAA